MDIISANTVIAVEETTASAVDDWEFIRLQDQKPGDIPDEYEAELTRGDIVDIFASIFGRGSCGSADAPDAYTGPAAGETPEDSAANYLADKYVGVDGAQQLAAEFGLGDLCSPDMIIDGGEIDVTVYLHASSFADYDIVSYDAELSTYSVREHDIYARVEFSNTSFAPLYYYVDLEKLGDYLANSAAYGEIYEWRGSVKGEDGETVESPSWTIANGRVYFAGNWSGILIFKRLPIKYHIYTLTISGTVDGDATRHYDARVSAQAAGLEIVNLDIAKEMAAEETAEECSWLDFDYGPNGTGTGTDTTCGNCDEQEESEEPEEPDPPPTCDSTITAEEYNEECCGGPLPLCLPECRSITTTVQGPITGDEPEEYCGETSVITLMPADGQPCGVMTKSWSTDTRGCCDGIVPLVYLDDNPKVIAQGGGVDIAVSGGRDEVTWSLSGVGQGFYFVNGEEEIEGGRSVRVYASDTSCGTITVTADDGCSTDDGGLSSTGGKWTLLQEDTCVDNVYLSDYCIVDERGSDGLFTRKKYRDNWCVDLQSNCEGDEQEHCERPDFGGHTPITVECIEKWEWGC